MPEPRLPIITLTTDFGSADHHVGAVKAANQARAAEILGLRAGSRVDLAVTTP